MTCPSSSPGKAKAPKSWGRGDYSLVVGAIPALEQWFRAYLILTVLCLFVFVRQGGDEFIGNASSFPSDRDTDGGRSGKESQALKHPFPPLPSRKGSEGTRWGPGEVPPLGHSWYVHHVHTLVSSGIKPEHWFRNRLSSDSTAWDLGARTNQTARGWSWHLTFRCFQPRTERKHTTGRLSGSSSTWDSILAQIVISGLWHGAPHWAWSLLKIVPPSPSAPPTKPLSLSKTNSPPTKLLRYIPTSTPTLSPNMAPLFGCQIIHAINSRGGWGVVVKITKSQTLTYSLLKLKGQVNAKSSHLGNLRRMASPDFNTTYWTPLITLTISGYAPFEELKAGGRFIYPEINVASGQGLSIARTSSKPYT